MKYGAQGPTVGKCQGWGVEPACGPDPPLGRVQDEVIWDLASVSINWNHLVRPPSTTYCLRRQFFQG